MQEEVTVAYSWFRVDSAMVDHPKVMRLAAELQEPLADAYLNRVWSWVQRYAPSGFIPVELVDQLEAVIGARAPPITPRWSRSGGVEGRDPDPSGVEIQSRSKIDPLAIRGRLGAMLKVGLLDATEDGFEVHDWAQMQGKLVEKSERDAKAKRLKRRLEARDRRESGARRGEAEPEAKRDVTDVTDGRNGRDDLSTKSSGTPIRSAEPPPVTEQEKFLLGKAEKRRAAKLPIDQSPPPITPDDDWWWDLEKHGYDATRALELYDSFLADRQYRVDGKPLAQLDPPYPMNIFARDWRIYTETTRGITEAAQRRGAG
jgi:hypothetical protein